MPFSVGIRHATHPPGSRSGPATQQRVGTGTGDPVCQRRGRSTVQHSEWKGQMGGPACTGERRGRGWETKHVSGRQDRQRRDITGARESPDGDADRTHRRIISAVRLVRLTTQLLISHASKKAICTHSCCAGTAAEPPRGTVHVWVQTCIHTAIHTRARIHANEGILYLYCAVFSLCMASTTHRWVCLFVHSVIHSPSRASYCCGLQLNMTVPTGAHSLIE